MNELEVFKSEALALIAEVAAIEKQKKSLDELQKDMRSQILAAMERHNIKSFRNELMSITYTAPSVRETLDSKAVQIKYPAIYHECLKTSNVKASIRITLND